MPTNWKVGTNSMYLACVSAEASRKYRILFNNCYSFLWAGYVLPGQLSMQLFGGCKVRGTTRPGQARLAYIWGHVIIRIGVPPAVLSRPPAEHTPRLCNTLQPGWHFPLMCAPRVARAPNRICLTTGIALCYALLIFLDNELCDNIILR